jgi:hypothetical protein
MDFRIASALHGHAFLARVSFVLRQFPFDDAEVLNILDPKKAAKGWVSMVTSLYWPRNDASNAPTLAYFSVWRVIREPVSWRATMRPLGIVMRSVA